MWNQLKKIWDFLTPRQQERATPSLDDLKAMIQINLFKNDSVTTEDINLAAKAFGPNVAKIKGKSTEQTWQQISVIWWKYQMNYWKLTRMLPFQWMD